MIFVIQVLTIVFTWAMAKVQGPTVVWIEDHGSPPDVYKALHRYGAWVKFCFCVACAFWFLSWNWPKGIQVAVIRSVAAGLICFFWIWLMFDPLLNNLRRHGIFRPWYYLGENDADGRRWVKLFGHNAGKAKVYILSGLIILLNLILKLFL